MDVAVACAGMAVAVPAACMGAAAPAGDNHALLEPSWLRMLLMSLSSRVSTASVGVQWSPVRSPFHVSTVSVVVRMWYGGVHEYHGLAVAPGLLVKVVAAVVAAPMVSGFGGVGLVPTVAVSAVGPVVRVVLIATDLVMVLPTGVGVVLVSPDAVLSLLGGAMAVRAALLGSSALRSLLGVRVTRSPDWPSYPRTTAACLLYYGVDPAVDVAPAVMPMCVVRMAGRMCVVRIDVPVDVLVGVRVDDLVGVPVDVRVDVAPAAEAPDVDVVPAADVPDVVRVVAGVAVAVGSASDADAPVVSHSSDHPASHTSQRAVKPFLVMEAVEMEVVVVMP